MEEQLRQEVATLCKDIGQMAHQAALPQLIAQLDALQEKLIVLDYLQIREERFYENTKRLRGQLLAAVAATPLELPTAGAQLIPEPTVLQPIKETPQPISATPAPVVTQLEKPPVEGTPEAVAPMQAPKVEAVPAQVAPVEAVPVATIFDAFEPDTTATPEPAAAVAEAPKTLRSQDFAPNPEPVITAKPTPKAWQPKEVAPPAKQPATTTPAATLGDKMANNKSSLNDRLNKKAINIGLNDRLAFVKHLFAGSQEDYNRVISQLNTQTSWEEAETFIANFVKPDYEWGGKEDYETRFLELVRIKFEA